MLQQSTDAIIELRHANFFKAAEYQKEAQLISESGTASEITGAIQSLAGIFEGGLSFAKP